MKILIENKNLDDLSLYGISSNLRISVEYTGLIISQDAIEIILSTLENYNLILLKLLLTIIT